MANSVEMSRIQVFAESLDLVTEGDFLAVTGWADETAAAYRKRGEGPPWVRLGKSVFYPRDGLRAYLKARVHDTAPFVPKEAI